MHLRSGAIRQAGALLCLCLLLLSGQGHAQPQEQAIWQSAARLSQSGANAQALPLLEQLVSAAPQNKHYRFELALVLFRMERDVRAKFHLERLLGADLSAAERQLINRVIGTIDQRKIWSAYFSFEIKPETNGTKQTEGRQLVIGGLPLTLDEAAIGKSTTSLIINTGAIYTPTIRRGLKAQFSVGAYIKYSDEKALRDAQITGRVGLSFAPDPLHYWDGGLLLATRHSGGAHYSDTVGFYANHARRVGPAGTLRLGGQISRAFRRYGHADIDRSFVSTSYTHEIGGNAAITASGFADFNATDQPNLDGQRRGVSLRGSYSFKGGLTTTLTLRAEEDNRSGTNPVFGVKRQDRKLGVDLAIHHRDFRIGRFAPQINFGFERNRSNIPLADYTNHTVSFGLTRKF